MTKLCFDSAPPAFPTSIGIKFEGCPLILVALDGTETADEARDKVLAALLGAGYAGFINLDGKIQITMDCDGDLPTGVDEFGVAGGLPMDLGILICQPPGVPVAVQERTWGHIKQLYEQ